MLVGDWEREEKDEKWLARIEAREGRVERDKLSMRGMGTPCSENRRREGGSEVSPGKTRQKKRETITNPQRAFECGRHPTEREREED